MAAAGWVWRNTKSNNDITHRNRGSPSWICWNNKPLTHRTSSWSALFSSFRTALVYSESKYFFFLFSAASLLLFCYSSSRAMWGWKDNKSFADKPSGLGLSFGQGVFCSRRLKVPPKTFLELLTHTFQVEGWHFVLTTNFANKHLFLGTVMLSSHSLEFRATVGMLGISLHLITSIYFPAASCFLPVISPHSLWLPVQPLPCQGSFSRLRNSMVIQEGM